MSMELAVAIVRHWFSSGATDVRLISAGRGFSGARHWQVEHEGRLFVLRQWPDRGIDAGRLASIHNFQNRLAGRQLPVSAPLPTRDGATFLILDQRFWELAPWMPGSADYWKDPRPQKLAAALQTLARIHCVSMIEPAATDSPWRYGELTDGLKSRIRRLHALVTERGLDEIRSAIANLAGSERAAAEQTLDLVLKVGPREFAKARGWHAVKLPMAMCLRDIWHDHVLFTGDEVTGVIDFGAAEVSAPAADIARLLGSMVGDDWDCWAAGLAAYEAVRPLTDDEREAMRFFDVSGVVLSAANWLAWLYGPSAAQLAGTFDREAALNRFNILMGRLRNLAGA